MMEDAEKKGGRQQRKKVGSEDAPAADGNTEGSLAEIKAGAAESKRGQGKQRKAGSSGDCRFINGVSKSNLVATSGKCVLIDPGRRDLLFCTHEGNTPENRQVYRYTWNQKARETRSTRFRNIREKDSAKHRCYIKTWAGQGVPRRVLRWADDGPHIAGARLAKNLWTKFGQDAVLVMGSWFVPMNRYHEPIRGKGVRVMLRKHRFQVYLLDKNRTSKTCPTCYNGELSTFHDAQNPRPFRRATGCSNKKCLESVANDCSASAPRPRCWDQDLAAVLNFRHILTGLRENGKILEWFRRTRTAARPTDEHQPDQATSEQRPAKCRRKARKQE
ncbi:hypothetical protein EDC05_001113 [Coemansia umbellata]|uniref:Uncharacterized protein n=1 Tax=Coemansia umbellata TaxID=1424467 RepID=A0ABQ8PSW8_9FUNG|nr:hypothetical protein EDC05_001113 [Coemansia umbellata]